MTQKKQLASLPKIALGSCILAVAILSTYLFINWPAIDQQIRFTTNTLPQKDLTAQPTIDYISIPKLNVKAPLIWATTAEEDNLQQKLLTGIVHYPQTALPGESGNGIYLGHSSNYWWEKSDYSTVFALLNKLETGDEIIIVYHQQKLVYKVQAKKILPKNSSEIFMTEDDTQQITLVTCWPLGTDWQNLIVRAEI